MDVAGYDSVLPLNVLLSRSPAMEDKTQPPPAPQARSELRPQGAGKVVFVATFASASIALFFPAYVRHPGNHESPSDHLFFLSGTGQINWSLTFHSFLILLGSEICTRSA